MTNQTREPGRSFGEPAGSSSKHRNACESSVPAVLPNDNISPSDASPDDPTVTSGIPGEAARDRERIGDGPQFARQKTRRVKRRTRHGCEIDLRGTEAGEAIDRACESDRLWFERHPGESVRIRPLMSGEFAPFADPVESLMLVRQLFPGSRLRTPLPLLGVGHGQRR